MRTTTALTGRECRFPQAFYNAFSACMGAFLKEKLHESQHVVVFDPSQIHRVHPEFGGELAGGLGGLAYRLDQGDRAGFDLASATLLHRLRLPDARLQVLNRHEVGDFPRATGDTEPTAPAAEFLRRGSH